jgi:hypothetical protein
MAVPQVVLVGYGLFHLSSDEVARGSAAESGAAPSP